MLFGVDVSYRNGIVNWHQLKQGIGLEWGHGACHRLDFALCRAISGTSVDPLFQRNWLHIRQVGLLRGAFAYAPSSDEPIVAADFFLRTVRPDVGDIVALRVAMRNGWSDQQLSDWAEQWLDHIHRVTGARPLVATSDSRSFVGSRAEPRNYPLWTSEPSRQGSPEQVDSWQSGAIIRYRADSFGFSRNGSMHDLSALRDYAVPAHKTPPTNNGESEPRRDRWEIVR